MRSSQVLLSWVLVAIARAAPAPVLPSTPATTTATTTITSGDEYLGAVLPGIGPVSTDIPAVHTTTRSDTPSSAVTVTTTTLTLLEYAMVPNPSPFPIVPAIHLPQNITADPAKNIGIPTCKDNDGPLGYDFELGNFATEHHAIHLMDAVLMAWLDTTEVSFASEYPFEGGRIVDKGTRFHTFGRGESGTWAAYALISESLETPERHLKPVWKSGLLARLVKEEMAKWPLITREQMKGESGCFDPDWMKPEKRQ